MSSGILRNWHVSKLTKIKSPVEYFFAMQEYAYYEMIVLKFNTAEKFRKLFDK